MQPTIDVAPTGSHPTHTANGTALSKELLGDFAAALKPRLAGDLRFDALTCALYATDASLFEMMPIGVLIPRHLDDVQAALEEARRLQIPILPRGAGSSLAGQTVATALAIDFTKFLDEVIEINVEERWVRTQPGLTLDRLNMALKPHGLMVGPDPASASRATVGGSVGNNATGTHSILYGSMVDHILEIDTFLAGGTPAHFGPLALDAWQTKLKQSGQEGHIYQTLDRLLRERADVIRRDTPDHWRRSSGYRMEYLLGEPGGDGAATRNVAQLLAGSEGTLAVSRELKLGLVPLPKRTALGVIHYRSRDTALRTVPDILETDPSAVELFDGVTIDQARHAPGFRDQLESFIDGEPDAALITEYFGESEAELEAKLDELQRTMDHVGGSYNIVRVTDPARIPMVWNVRKEALGLIMGVKGDYKPLPLIEDAAVPVKNLADYIQQIDGIMQETDTRVVFFAHASAGCLHIRPFLNTKTAQDVEKLRTISRGSMELVKQYGGVIASEHGDGITRGWLNEEFLGEDLCGVYREVKDAFDPQHLLNPNKILDVPPVTENLRISPQYQVIPLIEELDWAEDGSFAQAIEMCNGNGACRKLESGVMCPSFMVTREEEHSTRGRANALRAAMSGAVPIEEFTSKRMYEIMDLCIQCRGCKNECPSNVDMGKIKTEWLSKYWKVNKIPPRVRLFAHQPRMARKVAGTPLARLTNWVNRLGPVRKMMDRTLGVSERRDLPPFAPETFAQWFKKQSWTADGPTVVLFADTFNNCHLPETAKAAAEFLHRAGYNLIVPDTSACCGRTYLSKGFIAEAQLTALDATEKLYPYAAQGYPIVGLEPSCILAFADDFLSLLPGDPRVEKVAEHVMTFDGFVAQEADKGALDHLRWKANGAHKVLLHGHCHQKALLGTASTVRALGLPGYEVESLDTSCCGMAGAFGYESEHVDISLKMAERRLAPAVREASAETIVAAPGFSCRSQIKDAAAREAKHPAEILRDALA